MRATIEIQPTNSNLPSWTHDPEVIKWKAKFSDITTRLATHDWQVSEVVLGIQELEDELVSTRSSVILGESEDSAVTECETRLAALRDQHTKLIEEEQALKVARVKAEAAMKEAEQDAKIQAADSLLLIYQDKLQSLSSALQLAVDANEELKHLEGHIASQRIYELGPLRKKFLKQVAITGIMFPDGVKDWEAYIAPIMEKSE